MLGERLREIRQLRNLTQNDVANFLKIKRQTYSSYERNRSLPDANTLSLLATYFTVSADYLLDREMIQYEVCENTIYPVKLTVHDNDDIRQQAEHIKTTLMGIIGLAYDGQVGNEETFKKVMQALDNGLQLAKQEAKEKYTTKI